MASLNRRRSVTPKILVIFVLMVFLPPLILRAVGEEVLAERVSISSLGDESNGDSVNPALSADGNLVAFESRASNLVVGDTNGQGDIFVHNRQTGVTTRVSIATGGGEGNGDSVNPALSADGNLVAFESRASTLVVGDTNGQRDIFVHNRQKGLTTRESVPAPGLQADGLSNYPSLNDDGDVVAFASRAANLVVGDNNKRQDIFTQEPTQLADLIARGADIFFNEKFEGNGRTCGTCHPAENNFTLDPAFIATLPPDDALFVAEFNPALAQLENPVLMRQFGLIRENLDGFNKPGVMRGVPHTLGLSTSVVSFSGPRTGWSGDGAPVDGTLRSFAIGAVTQHFPKTLNRVAGVDFRLPTDDELDALEAFQLSLGRQADLSLPLPLKGLVPTNGQTIFLSNTVGKCNLCHVNAGASVNLGAGSLGNFNFNIGVENLPNQPADLTGEPNPPDDGFGTPGDGSFNVPPLVEAASTPPFFHNNSVQTIEGAVEFYNSAAFNSSPSALQVGGISLAPTQVEAVAAFLRVINALEKIRSAIQQEQTALLTKDKSLVSRLVSLAGKDLDDAISVLQGAGLHPDAVSLLEEAKSLIGQDLSLKAMKQAIKEAIEKEEAARGLLVDTS